VALLPNDVHVALEPSMQLAADIEQRPVRLAHRLRIVHELRDGERVQDLRVPKATPRVLQVRLEQEGRIPGDAPTGGADFAQFGNSLRRSGPPQIEEPLPQRPGYTRIARDMPDGQK